MVVIESIGFGERVEIGRKFRVIHEPRLIAR